MWVNREKQKRLLTGECHEVIYQVNVLLVWIGGDGVHLSLELCVLGIALIHHAYHKHLYAGGMGLRGRVLGLHRVTAVRLPVRENQDHLPDAGSRGLEQLVGPLDGTAGEGALAQVGHLPDGGLDVVLAGLLRQADHHHVHVAVEHHADAAGLAAHRHAVDQHVDKVLHHLKVLWAHALGAVNHKHQLQGALPTLQSTACTQRSSFRMRW